MHIEELALSLVFPAQKRRSSLKIRKVPPNFKLSAFPRTNGLTSEKTGNLPLPELSFLECIALAQLRVLNPSVEVWTMGLKSPAFESRKRRSWAVLSKDCYGPS